ncbi:MAG: hypothetical protein AAGG38_03835 [Planctomycetota bacterium]
MIGQLIFWQDTQRHTATLQDDLTWTCEAADIASHLNQTFPGRTLQDIPDLVIGRHLLYQTAERLSGRVEVPTRLSPRPNREMV